MPVCPLRVLFLLQRPEAWINLASVWQAMASHPGVAPTVWLLPYNVTTPEINEGKLRQAQALLQAAGVVHETWHEGLIPGGSGNFDAVIFNHPYDRERPAPLWFDRLTQLIPVSVYIPYGLSVGGGTKNLHLQYAQPTQMRASAVVARSPAEKELYRLHCPNGNSHVQVLGHPRFDFLLQQLSEPIPKALLSAIAGRRAVLWNAHFSFGHKHSQNSNFSTFDLVGPEIFEYALRHHDRLCLIWRPHPGLLPSIVREGLLTQEDLPALRAELQACGIVLDENPVHAHTFNASDALITDPGSFLLEYLATGKPVLAMLNPEGEGFNEEAEALVKGYARSSTPGGVINFLNNLLCGQVAQPHRSLRDHHLPMLDGRAGQRVTALVAELCGRVGLARDLTTSCLSTRHEESTDALSRKDPIEQKVSTNPTHTPVLDHLCAGLRRIRAEKQSHSSWQKFSRRQFNQLRTRLVEWLKQYPRLLNSAKSTGRRS